MSFRLTPSSVLEQLRKVIFEAMVKLRCKRIPSTIRCRSLRRLVLSVPRKPKPNTEVDYLALPVHSITSVSNRQLLISLRGHILNHPKSNSSLIPTRSTFTRPRIGRCCKRASRPCPVVRRLTRRTRGTSLAFKLITIFVL